jgi:hypothetical protein
MWCDSTMRKAQGALFFAWLGALCVAGITNCRPSQEESPVSAYNSFAETLRRGDLKSAYGYLSGETRQAIEQRTQAVSAASGGLVKSDPATWIFGSAGRPPPLTEVKLLSLDGGTATVRAAGGSLTTNVTMVRERTGWKVDLRERLDRPSQ